MDPNRLRPDELEYELTLRRLGRADASNVKHLQELLDAEESGEVAAPTGSQRLTRQNVQEEFQQCDAKLLEIRSAIDEALQYADDAAAQAGESRLVHLIGRVGRLRTFAPLNPDIMRLDNKLATMKSTMKVARDSLGSGEDPCQQQAVPSEGAVGGVLRSPLPDQRQVPQQFDFPPPGYASTRPKRAASRSLRNLSVSESNPIDMPTMYHQHAQPACVPERSQIQEPQRIVNAVPLHHHAEEQRSTFRRQEALGLSGGHLIGKWSLRFSGAPKTLDVDDFLFRVERQARLHGVSDGALAIGVGDLLTCGAADWFWSFQRKFDNPTWFQLRQAFIRRYAAQRESDYAIRSRIEHRVQRIGESFGDFAQDL